MAASISPSETTTGGKTLRPEELEIHPRRPSQEPGILSPRSWRHNFNGPVHGAQKHGTGSVDIDDYFVGPRDISRHSKWPFFMRMHGSILPKLILPLLFVASWAAAITVVSEKTKHQLSVKPPLLGVLGFVVGLAISFRTSSAYERYAEGRKYWSQLNFVGQNLARTLWIHATEREGDLGKEDLLGKVTALNLILSFAVALKHKLRFEPGIDYDDLRDLVSYLDTFAKAAEPEIPKASEPGKLKAVGNYLGVTFAESNPRKRIKRSKKPLGNLPLEILGHLSSYVDEVIANGTLSVSLYQNQAITSVVSLNEILIGTERVLNTPLPLAYTIAISQITWVYVMLLPFQLWADLGWITIPGTVFAAYIILGIAAIGREIENPFGSDVNDLPLDAYCEELACDLDVISSMPKPVVGDWMRRRENRVFWPLSEKGWEDWIRRDKSDMREALTTKMRSDMAVRRSINPERRSESEADEKGHLHAAGQQAQHPDA